jgi:uncharacterized membrane protein
MSAKLDKETLYSMNQNPFNWKGMFYVNPKDPRIVFQKKEPSMGWTLNFGRTISYVIIIAFVLAVIASIFLIK